jgi:hypothetical protein
MLRPYMLSARITCPACGPRDVRIRYNPSVGGRGGAGTK